TVLPGMVVESPATDEARLLAARMVEAVKAMLYGAEGEARANAEGRKVWYDPITLQITIVDSPENIQRASEYLNSVAEIKSGATLLKESFAQSPTPPRST